MCQATFGYHEYDSVVSWTEHKVSPRLKPNDFLIGIEHELEEGGETRENAIAITTAMGFPCDETHDIVVAYDGSLTDGWEFITHPATYEYHMNVNGKGYDWEAGLAKARSLGFVGEGEQDDDDRWIGGHAGTHFNVSRKSLSGGKENVEHNLMLLFNNNSDWLMSKFSRRTNTENEFHYCTYDETSPKITPKDIRNNFERVQERLTYLCEHSRDHYAALNLGKSSVVEFRFMTSTTYYKWFVAGLQMIMMLCWCAKNMSLEEAAAVRFPWFLQCAKANGYSEFVEYCRQRRINITPLQFAY